MLGMIQRRVGVSLLLPFLEALDEYLIKMTRVMTLLGSGLMLGYQY